MSTNVFNIKEVLMTGWEGFTKNLLLFIVLPLAMIIVSSFTYIFAMFFIAILPFLIVLLPIVLLLEALLLFYVLFCMITASLAVLRGETPSWGILKIDIASFIRFSAVLIIIMTATAIASLAVSLIFPIFGASAVSMLLAALLLAVINVAAVTFFFPAQYIIADKKEVSIINAVKNSWNMTFPRAVPCLLFILTCFAINLIGSLFFGLGLIITAPVTVIAAACAYKKLDSADMAATSVPEAAVPAETTEK